MTNYKGEQFTFEDVAKTITAYNEGCADEHELDMLGRDISGLYRLVEENENRYGLKDLMFGTYYSADDLKNNGATYSWHPQMEL